MPRTRKGSAARRKTAPARQEKPAETAAKPAQVKPQESKPKFMVDLDEKVHALRQEKKFPWIPFLGIVIATRKLVKAERLSPKNGRVVLTPTTYPLVVAEYREYRANRNVTQGAAFNAIKEAADHIDFRESHPDNQKNSLDFTPAWDLVKEARTLVTKSALKAGAREMNYRQAEELAEKAVEKADELLFDSLQTQIEDMADNIPDLETEDLSARIREARAMLDSRGRVKAIGEVHFAMKNLLRLSAGPEERRERRQQEREYRAKNPRGKQRRWQFKA